MPIENIDAFRNAIRWNQDLSGADKIALQEDGGAVQVKRESLGHRIFRHIHQSEEEKRANREVREAFWQSVSAVYTRRKLAIPEHVLRALAEDGVPPAGRDFPNVDKPLSARVVRSVLAAMDLDLNLIAAAQKEVSDLQAEVKRQMAELDLRTKTPEFDGIFAGDHPVSAKDYSRLSGSGVLEAMRIRFQEGEAEFSKLIAEGNTQYCSAREECQRLLDKLEDFERAGKAYELAQACIYAPLVKATCDYQGLVHAYNNAIFSDAQKQRVRKWSSNPRETDQLLRAKPELNVASLDWKNELGYPYVSTKKLNALSKEYRSTFLYTLGSSHINAPLAGFAGGYYGAPNVGVGNTSWNVPISEQAREFLLKDDADTDVGDAREHIAGLTTEIDKHFNDEDFEVLRGTRSDQLASMLHVSEEALRKLPVGEHSEMCLKQGYFPAFTSTSHSDRSCRPFMQPQGDGPNLKAGVVMRIFCPKGTKMLYITPASYFSHGSEYELLLQRGAHFRVSRFNKVSETRYEVDLEIHPELGYTMVAENLSAGTQGQSQGVASPADGKAVESI